MNLQAWHDVAEQLKPILECIAIGVGALTLIKWYWEWNNRATDVLLKLEEEFEKKCGEGRFFLEDDAKYKKLADVLAKVTESGNRWRLGGSDLETLIAIDNLLRFYVVLYGVREARQVPERSLSTCYRFWMAHYYRKDRQVFRQYVNAFFPTLKRWLKSDVAGSTRIWRRPFSPWWRSFFRPIDFWDKESLETRATNL